MSAFGLITGKLVGQPVTRPTKTGGSVTFFKLRVASGATLEWWSVATFAETARGELADLPDGTPVSAVGELQIEEWERDGKRGFNRKLTASSVVALKGKPKLERRAPTALTPKRARTRPINRDAVARVAESPRYQAPGAYVSNSPPAPDARDNAGALNDDLPW